MLKIQWYLKKVTVVLTKQCCNLYIHIKAYIYIEYLENHVRNQKQWLPLGMDVGKCREKVEED